MSTAELFDIKYKKMLEEDVSSPVFDLEEGDMNSKQKKREEADQELRLYNKMENVVLRNRLLKTVHFSSMSCRYIICKMESDFKFPGRFKFCSGSIVGKFFVSYDSKPTFDSFFLATEQNEFLLPMDPIKSRPSYVYVLACSTHPQIAQVGISFLKKPPPPPQLPSLVSTNSQQLISKNSSALIESLDIAGESQESLQRRKATQKVRQITLKKNAIIASVYKDFKETKLVIEEKDREERRRHVQQQKTEREVEKRYHDLKMINQRKQRRMDRMNLIETCLEVSQKAAITSIWVRFIKTSGMLYTITAELKVNNSLANLRTK